MYLQKQFFTKIVMCNYSLAQFVNQILSLFKQYTNNWSYLRKVTLVRSCLVIWVQMFIYYELSSYNFNEILMKLPFQIGGGLRHPFNLQKAHFYWGVSGKEGTTGKEGIKEGRKRRKGRKERQEDWRTRSYGKGQQKIKPKQKKPRGDGSK